MCFAWLSRDRPKASIANEDPTGPRGGRSVVYLPASVLSPIGSLSFPHITVTIPAPTPPRQRTADLIDRCCAPI